MRKILKKMGKLLKLKMILKLYVNIFIIILAEINLDKGGRYFEIEGKENRSVFVSNLDFAITELEVKDAFSSVGHCEVLLVKDYKCRSKGFGYVLFEKPVSIEHHYGILFCKILKNYFLI